MRQPVKTFIVAFACKFHAHRSRKPLDMRKAANMITELGPLGFLTPGNSTFVQIRKIHRQRRKNFDKV